MSPACPAPMPSSVCPVKVLVVENEYIFASTLKETLEALSYTVTGLAASAVETLCQVRQTRPDTVLMGLQLRGSLDGIQTATYLWYTYQLPVIYMLGHAEPVTLARVAASPAFGCLTKPVQKADLVTTINGAYLSRQAQ